MDTYKVDYDNLIDWINKGRNKISRSIANNTFIRKEDNKVIVQLHNTDICIITKESIQIFTGGYKTYTTKNRINSFLPDSFRLYQDRKIWYLWNWQTKEKWNYTDGITINLSDNSVSSQADNKQLDKDKKLKSRIDKFVSAYIERLFNGKIERNYGGDCFYCQMREVNSNKPLGDVIKDNNHLLSHMREKYYVPSMLVNAIELYPVSMAAKRTLQELWIGETKLESNTTFGDIAKEQLTKSLRKYLYSHFSLPV